MSSPLSVAIEEVCPESHSDARHVDHVHVLHIYSLTCFHLYHRSVYICCREFPPGIQVYYFITDLFSCLEIWPQSQASILVWLLAWILGMRFQFLSCYYYLVRLWTLEVLSGCGYIAPSLFQACFLGYETAMRALNWVLPNWWRHASCIYYCKSHSKDHQFRDSFFLTV